jgi:hypothetical protein
MLMCNLQSNIENAYSMMGATLSYLQTVERIFRFVTTYVIQDGDGLSFEGLQALCKRDKKKALGYFMRQLREQSALPPAFDALLSSFLSMRNDFVHSHDRIPGWDVNTEDGRLVAHQFMSTLLQQSHKINEILIALVMRWQQDVGIQTSKFQEDQFFTNAYLQYEDLIDTFFNVKDT